MGSEVGDAGYTRTGQDFGTFGLRRHLKEAEIGPVKSKFKILKLSQEYKLLEGQPSWNTLLAFDSAVKHKHDTVINAEYLILWEVWSIPVKVLKYLLVFWEVIHRSGLKLKTRYKVDFFSERIRHPRLISFHVKGSWSRARTKLVWMQCQCSCRPASAAGDSSTTSVAAPSAWKGSFTAVFSSWIEDEKLVMRNDKVWLAWISCSLALLLKLITFSN